MNFLQHYVDNLRPRAITRDSAWGIPVPLKEAKDKVFYVWFDAPIGYLSASMEWAQLQGEPDKWRDYWCDSKTRLVHFIGKDNIFFHGILFPAMTLGQDQPYKLVDDLPANEFLKLEGRQFSKSEGWTIDLPDFLQRYTVDQLRYALAANAPETADSDFTWRDFQMRCNSELVGKYGNLINRTLVFAQRYCSGQVPPLTTPNLAHDFFEQIDDLLQQIRQSYQQYRLRRVCQLIMELATLGNTYFNAQQPWIHAKQEAGKATVDTTIHACLFCLKALAIVSFPVMPTTAEKIWQLLACPGHLAQTGWEAGLKQPLPEGRILPQPEILFEKVSDEQIAAEETNLRR
jgi:methionyl-tRNA synthetase